jgi:quinol monooxygenase YgiN
MLRTQPRTKGVTVIQLLVRLVASPGRNPEMLRTLGTIRLTAQLDRGCSRTHLGSDALDPEVLFYIEEWPRRENLDRRLRSPDFRTLLALLEAAAAAPVVEFRTVSEIRGLDYVAAVRGETGDDPVTASSTPPGR